MRFTMKALVFSHPNNLYFISAKLRSRVDLALTGTVYPFARDLSVIRGGHTYPALHSNAHIISTYDSTIWAHRKAFLECGTASGFLAFAHARR
jgi:hypothetical protein